MLIKLAILLISLAALGYVGFRFTVSLWSVIIIPAALYQPNKSEE